MKSNAGFVPVSGPVEPANTSAILHRLCLMAARQTALPMASDAGSTMLELPLRTFLVQFIALKQSVYDCTN
jgi:hypothetical protein